MDHSREIAQAIAALTAEMLKLSLSEGEARSALSVTIENALSRLVSAIVAKTNLPNAPPEKCPVEIGTPELLA